MTDYQKELIKEHSDLSIRLEALSNNVYGKDSDKDDKIEFANKSIQLSAMKTYEYALCARMQNVGIVFDNNNYFERVAEVKYPVRKEEVDE